MWTLQVKFAMFGQEGKPLVLLCPSMSNTPFPVDVPERGEKAHDDPRPTRAPQRAPMIVAFCTHTRAHGAPARR